MTEGGAVPDFEHVCLCGQTMVHQTPWGAGGIFICIDLTDCGRLVVVVPETGRETWYSPENRPQ